MHDACRALYESRLAELCRGVQVARNGAREPLKYIVVLLEVVPPAVKQGSRRRECGSSIAPHCARIADRMVERLFPLGIESRFADDLGDQSNRLVNVDVVARIARDGELV